MRYRLIQIDAYGSYVSVYVLPQGKVGIFLRYIHVPCLGRGFLQFEI